MKLAGLQCHPRGRESLVMLFNDADMSKTSCRSETCAGCAGAPSDS